MKKNVFKSIGAVLAGLLFIAVTHSATDAYSNQREYCQRGIFTRELE